MGYWAKDGSYVHDEHDMNVRPLEGVPGGSGIREESEYSKLLKREAQLQAERQAERARQEEREIKERIKSNIRRDKEFEVAAIIRAEQGEAFRNLGWFRRAVATRKGKDFYSRQSEIYHEALEQARTMSDLELDNIIEKGRTR